MATRSFSPSTVLSLIAVLMFGWGITTMAMGWTQDLRGLVVCRVFLGVFEAGLLPGCVYIVSMWYKRDEGTHLQKPESN